MKKYRKNVAIVVMNADKKVLVCKRRGDSTALWQFPQGGIDERESVEQAAFRELKEETSIKSAKLLFVLDKPIRYDFPEKVLAELWKLQERKFHGQEQYWVLMYFYGKNPEINLETREPEFAAYKWEDVQFAETNVVDFKKASYAKALSLLKPYIEAYKPER